MKHNFFRNRQPRLHTRVGAALGLLIIVLAFSLAFVMARTAEKQVLSQSAENLQGLSGQMSRELSGGMDRFIRAVVTQTERNRFRDPRSSVDSMRDALDEFKRTNPEFAYVSIIDARSARVIAASGGIFEGGDATGRPVFERGRSGPFVGDVHDAVRLAERLPKPANGEPLRLLDIAAPIPNAGGQTFRVFAAHVAWQWTDSVRKEVFGPVKATRGVEAFLVDTAGKVVLAATPALEVGTPLGRIVHAPNGPAEVLTWPDGVDCLTVVASTAPHGSFPGFGWKVVVRQPVTTAAAAASNLRTAFLAGALLLGAAGAAIAWMLTGRLMRPVRLLAEAAARAQSGAPVEPMTAGGAEVSAVQTAIAQLAELAHKAQHETEAKHLSQRQFSVLADSLPQVVFQADATGGLEYINQDWIAEAATSERFCVDDLARLVPPDERAQFTEAWAASLALGTDLKVRCRLDPHDGTAPRWFDIAARAVKSDAGATTKWVGTLFDVDDIVNRVEQANQALDEERAARLDAERIARMKDEFLATVSHELRSPLSVITGWSDVLRRKGGDNPMVMKAAEVIRINARLQTALINDLLDITAVIAEKMTLDAEPLDLALLGNEGVLSHLNTAQTKGVALVCRAPLPCFVHADRRRMTQVIANLLGNAIKFTEPGGSIELTVATTGSEAVLAVRDTGRGIAPEFLAHVFERMRQEDSSTTRRAGGLGLGLAIVDGLVRLHGGRVSVESDGIDKGAVFTVRLPALAEPPRNLPTPHAGAADDEDRVTELQGKRILLVDDEADAREVAQVALSSLGAEVRVASSGAEVLKILKLERFDALVSDIGMPEMNGLSLIRQIRLDETGSSQYLPAVALTAFAMESDRLAGIQAGFQAYVAKPISLRRLSEAVELSIRSTNAV